MSPVPSANWSYPTSIRIGPGRVRELADACLVSGMRRPLVVTDPGLAGLPMVHDAIEANVAAGVPSGLFSNLKPNPIGQNVTDGVAAYRAGAHDGIVAFGGGSALDTGKAIALMAGQSRPMWDFEDVGNNWTRADPESIAPVVAVPTTAGTGSEVGRASVITDEATHTKRILFHPRMLPRVVIEDPELCVGLPPGLTAATGMDALAHCLEAYCAPGFHPMADGIAVEGVRLVKQWLPVAVKDGTDLEARTAMLAAASMGATAFQKGLGAIHSLSHPVGALYDTHHGLTNAVFMPYVLGFNRAAIDERMTRLAAWIGLPSPSFDTLLGWVLALREELAIPHALGALGVDDQRLEEIAGMGAADPTAATNPLPVGPPELRRILDAALAGDVAAARPAA